jgi:Tol biopolymer transport system component
MKNLIFLAGLSLFSFSETPLPKTPVQVLSHVRQLTFVGNKSGEGYFSADGKKMIFQSEREPGNPFYQIYLTDLQSGDTQRISPGYGKTTCAWIHPDQKKVMFSSSHLDALLKDKVKQELASRQSSVKTKYSWSFDEALDIFEYDLSSKKYKQLTREIGYDAEGSYSPDGKWIAFASNRHAYSERLASEDEKIFKMDPSYLMSIYLMKADGSQAKRLTFDKGYNGGPFFSADGKKITWRKFAPNGQSAEIWTMNADGSEQKQITRMGAMSWAPFFHPSGDYLIFTTNKMGFANFELYIVDSEGKKEPVRISFMDDFDGLPAFSPQGDKLAWTHKNEKNESQIYWADWDDKKARQLLGLPTPQLKLADLQPDIKSEDIKKIVSYLASEELGGRGTASPEEKKYTEAIATIFSQLDLKPLDSSSSFFQNFDFASGVELGQQSALTLQAGKQSVEAQLSQDFIPLAFSKTGEFKDLEVSFAGYGIVAPATEKQTAYDSFKGLDVRNKWVLAFRDIPESISNEKRIHLNTYSRLHHKALVASQRGAKGLLVVTGPNNPTQQKLMKFRFDGTFAEAGIPVISISDELADKLLVSSGRSLKKWQDVLDKGEIQNTSLKDVKISARVALTTVRSQARNVIAVLKAPGKSRSAIVIGAHGDHLGRGEMGSSLARAEEKSQIHVGADDNASGVAGVIELAHYFSDLQKKGKLHLQHDLIFAVWSGEEIGLIGSSYFVRQQKSPLLANLNMDMIGRLNGSLLIQGVGSAVQWKAMIEKLAPKTELSLATQEDPYLPTDSMAFYLKEIPAINFFTGAHSDYHTPRDKADLINSQAMVPIITLVKDLSLNIAEKEKPAVTYQKVESGHGKLEGRSFRIYLGTIPDYTQEGIKGVKISGTSKDSPAEKAGLQSGDVIVELSGIKIENLYDYVYCLQSIKAGVETQIKVSRQGKVSELSIVPLLKE